MKNKKKINIALIIVLIMFTCVTGIKAATILASSVTYGDKTVEDALDDLIEKANNLEVELTDGATTKLYESLKHSGLVTEDMTFDEMCTILAGTYPEKPYLYQSGNMCETLTGGWEALPYAVAGGGTAANLTFTTGDTSMTIQPTADSSETVRAGTLFTGKLIDLSKYDKLYLDGTFYIGGSYAYERIRIGLVSVKQNGYSMKVLGSWIDTTVDFSGTKEYDISAYDDSYYIAIEVTTNQVAITYPMITIRNMWLE